MGEDGIGIGDGQRGLRTEQLLFLYPVVSCSVGCSACVSDISHL